MNVNKNNTDIHILACLIEMVVQALRCRTSQLRTNTVCYWPGFANFFPSTRRTICQRDLLMVPCEYSVLRDMPTCERTENKNTKS